MKNRTSIRGLFRGDDGAELIEFALTAVILMVTILGTMEFGIAVWRYNMVSDLAQEGARWASVRGTTSVAPASAAAVGTYVQSRANGITVAVTTTTASGNGGSGACTSTAVNPSALAAGAGICVRVQTSYGAISGLLPGGVLNMESTAKMVMAR
ncbi:MAG: TadE/TadG family type IV pilus assembly protein [Vicinamibacterales bacterium]